MKYFAHFFLLCIYIFVTACGSSSGGGGGGSILAGCVAKGTLAVGATITDDAFTDVDGHCYTISLTANTHYTLTTSTTSTTMFSNATLIHDGTEDNITGAFGPLGGADGVQVFMFPESRDYILRMEGNEYTVAITLGGAPNTTSATTITSLSSPTNVTNGDPFTLDLGLLLGDSGTTSFSFIETYPTEVVRNVKIQVAAIGIPGTAQSTTVDYETKGDTSVLSGDITFEQFNILGSSFDSNYQLGAWPTTAYTGYILRQTSGYYGPDTLTPISLTINTPAVPIACAPGTLTGTVTLPATFSLGDSINVTVPLSVTTGTAEIFVTIAGTQPVTIDGSTMFTFTGTNSTATTGDNIVTIMVPSGTINVFTLGDAYTVSVSTLLGSQFDCTAGYAGNLTGGVYFEAQDDATLSVHYYNETTFVAPTITLQ